jgi:PiT family inorganic phosphate transporter
VPGTAQIFLGLAFVVGFYMAWNIGANDVANAFGTSVGSGALTIRSAIIIAAVCEFGGAFFVGAPVAQTISGNIVDVERFTRALGDPAAIGVGMAAALLGSAIWLNVATYFSQPVSTTHAIIGAVIGIGLVTVDPSVVKWGNMGIIAASWVVSPLVGGLLAYAIYRWAVRAFVLDSRHQVYRALQVLPVAIGALLGIVTFSITYHGLPKLKLDMPMWEALLVASAAGIVPTICIFLAIRPRMRRHRVRLDDRYNVVEKWFGYMQVATACYMAFAHGANDVANAIGPMATAITAFHDPGQLSGQVGVPPWLLAFGGVGIVIGLATYGYKVIQAVGKDITEITPTRGFAAAFATATTVLVFSKFGMPISTTFVIVGAVMGVGFARGFGAIDMKVIRKIFASWLVTIPISAVLGAGLFKLMMLLHG